MEIRLDRSEQASLDFVDGLMAYNSTHISASLFDWFTDRSKSLGTKRLSMKEVEALITPTTLYKFAAFFEHHNHSMMFQTTLEILEKQADEVRSWLDCDCTRNGCLGRLEWDPDLPIPSYYKNLEIHTQPGSYHGNDFAGFMYHWMIEPYLVHRDDNDQMGWALAKGVPKQDYRRILDMGCGIGKSTLPYCDLYPDAEVIGIDYAAPMVKYAHKLAEQRAKKVTFSQRNAESTQYEDESFDLIVAIWLFHEIPRRAMDNVIREAYRLLRPEGYFAIMESPPYKVLNEINPLSEFLLESVAHRMSDPFISVLFKLDRAELLRNGGFDNVREEPLENHLTGWSTDVKYFYGAFPWWMTIGKKV
jgi:ubiquinone/menaquinone biosynthesis C-methylase UbiE